MESARLVVYGCGTLGTLTAARYVPKLGHAVGHTETPARHGHLRHHGIAPALGSPHLALEPGDRLLVALPGTEAQRAALLQLATVPPPRRVVFVSSTAYYGLATAQVNEATPAGTDAHAHAVAEAEQLFRAWAGDRGVVLRLGGLYERGRGPLTALRERGAPPLGPPDRTLALIHYEDAAVAACEALVHPSPEPVYLGVVPPCPTRRDFYEAACVVLNLPLPQFDTPLKLPPAVFDTTRLRRDLLREPRHPRWQESLLP